MNGSKAILLCGVALLAAGCAIKPLPRDVSREDTYSIVQKIRCDTRAAIQHELIELLTDSENPESTRALGQAIADGTLRAGDLNFNDLDNTTRDLVIKYSEAGIAYDFSFDIYEDNDNSINLNLADPITNGTFTLGITGGHQRKRQNIRRFIVSNTFGELFDESSYRVCPGYGTPYANAFYPITGSIGMDEMIRTFLLLSEVGGLSAIRNKELDPNTHQLVDTLTFTTVFKKLTITPEVSLTPTTTSLHLTKAGGSLPAERSDEHKVIITLTAIDKPEGAAPSAQNFGAVTQSDAEAASVAGGERERVLKLNEDFLDILRDDADN